jgi:hypothetical protein
MKENILPRKISFPDFSLLLEALIRIKMTPELAALVAKVTCVLAANSTSIY